MAAGGRVLCRTGAALARRCPGPSPIGSRPAESGSRGRGGTRVSTDLIIRAARRPRTLQPGRGFTVTRPEREAAESYQTAIRLDPTDAEAHNNLGSVLHSLNRAAEAETFYRRAVALDANHGPAAFNLGALLVDRRRYEEGIGWLRPRRRFRPIGQRYSCGWAWLCIKWTCSTKRSCIAGACSSSTPRPRRPRTRSPVATNCWAIPTKRCGLFVRRFGWRPKAQSLHSNLLYALNYLPDLSAAEVFAEHRQWAARHADPLTAAASEFPPRANHQRLRLGYVSATFQGSRGQFLCRANPGRARP